MLNDDEIIKELITLNYTKKVSQTYFEIINSKIFFTAS